MADENVSYVFYTKVDQVIEREDGWWVQYNGSRESLFLGKDKPPFKPGDEIEIIQRKRNAKPSQTPL